MTNQDLGKKLVELCREGKNLEAIESLYADNIVSVEAVDVPGMEFGQVTEGRDAVVAKNTWWLECHDVHSSEIRGPFPHGERFAVIFAHEATAKAGPMAGQRYSMEEVALYTVKGGKIAREEFFYAF